MSIPRWYKGLHPVLGVYGVWLSKPGINVLTASQTSDFLLSPTVKFEQVILSGRVNLAPGDTQIVPFIVALTAKPYVFLKSSTSSSEIYYPYQLYLDTQTGAQLNPRYVGVFFYNNQMLFQNPNEYAFVLSYMVFLRSSGL